MEYSYFYSKGLLNAAEYMGLVCAFFLRKNPSSVLVYALIGLIIIFCTDRKYFPYLSKLHISDTYVERRVAGFPIVKLSRNNMYYRQCRIGGTDFAVFSSESVARCSQIGITYLARKRRAILYPFTPKMKVDLAELFQISKEEINEAMNETQVEG